MPDTGDKRRSYFVNGVWLALAVVGLGLVSNRLLDMTGVAKEAGLTVDERKEKAARNNADYAETYGSSKLDAVAWFSREKYDCENEAVIEEAKNQLACSKLFTCSALGYANLSEVVAGGPSVIASRVEVARDRETKNAIKRMVNPTEADLRWSTRLFEKIADHQRGILTSFPRLFQNVRSVADDFNPNVSKYVCRMTFQYDPAIVVPWWSLSFRFELMQDQNTLFVAGEQLKKDPNADYISQMTETAMRANGIYAKAQRVPTSTAKFSVQPSNNGRFVVEILDTPLPGN